MVAFLFVKFASEKINHYFRKMIINFTGQPESGKTTLSHLLKKELDWYYPDHKVIILDGDVIRKVTDNYDYTEAGRKKNIRSAYDIALSIIKASQIDPSFNAIVILAIISPYRAIREELKTQANVLEYYLTSSRRSRAQFNVKDYEPPLKNYFHLDTDQYDGHCIRIIAKHVKDLFAAIETKVIDV